MKNLWSKWTSISVSKRMLVGMALGLICGFIFGEPIVVIKPFGTIFINMLKMVMVPIVFVSITLSIANMDDIKKFGRIAGQTFGLYVLTTICASAIGLCYAFLIKPGLGFSDAGATAVEQTAQDISVVDTLVNIVPTNIIQASAESNLLQIIFFAILFGVALSLISEKKRPVVDFLISFQDAVIRMVQMILQYAPIGVFALMASIAGQYGTAVFSTLGKFILTDYLGFITVIIVVYGIVLATCKINLITFLSRAKDAIVTAFTTTSSAATVPVELEISESHLGVPKEIGGFCYPFGATINQNGTAINITCCVLFSAQVYGFHFTPAQLAILVMTALISSVGCSGIPGGGTVFTLAILAQYGIPTEAFGMIIACYTLVDMGSTTMNICGDMVCAIRVCKSQGKLDQKVWQKGYQIPKAN